MRNHQTRRWVLVGSGMALLSAAALLSSNSIERAMIGVASGALGWGPTLFRALLGIHGLMLVLLGASGTPRPRAAPAAGQRTPAPSKWAWLVLSILTVLALGLRFWRLESDLWLDEVLTLLDFVRRTPGQIVTSFPSQNQHMLYSILAHASIRAFGENAWSLRLPSVLFGVGSIWSLFLLGRRLFGPLQALLSCALMTVSYHHIWFSQNARGYTGLLFFTLLATWLWLEASEGRSSLWPLYAAILALGLWLHVTLIFVPIAHGIVYLVGLLRAARNPPTSRLESTEVQAGWKPLAAWLLCGTLTLQLYALSLPEFLRTALHEVSLPSDWTNPWWILRESLRGGGVGFKPALILLGSAVAGVGCWSLLRQNVRMTAAFTLPAVLGAVALLGSGHNLWPRFFFFSIGFALLIVVAGAIELPSLLLAMFRRETSQYRLARHAGLALVSLMIAGSAATVPRCYAVPKQDFKGARNFVEQNRRPDEAVVAIGLAGRIYAEYLARDWKVAQTPAELDAIRQAHSQVWLVYTLPIELQAYHPALWRVVRNDFRMVKGFPGTLGGGEVYVCRPTVPESISYALQMEQR